jgi:hypothetical protein
VPVPGKGKWTRILSVRPVGTATPIALIALIALASPGTGSAQFCTPVAQEPRHEFQFLAGYSPGSSTVIGSTRDRRFVLAGFTYTYLCKLRESTSIGYTAGAFPAAVLLQPDNHAVYGFAIAPIGLTAEFARRHRVHPFVEGLGGVIASTEPIPQNGLNATGLNFFFDLGGGMRWRAGRRSALTIGYKFLHISNAGTTSFNPGVDNNVVYMGYAFRR